VRPGALELGKALTVEGDGSHFRDFIHVTDITRGLVMAGAPGAPTSDT